jgi:hypothetical protein
MWSLVGKNNPSKTLYLKYCQTKRDIKKAVENKCWKERDGTHTFRKVDMCKWQMGDPDTYTSRCHGQPWGFTNYGGNHPLLKIIKRMTTNHSPNQLQPKNE